MPDRRVRTSTAVPRRRRGAPRIAGATWLTASLVACGGDGTEPETTTSTGIANPASVYCVDQGGVVEIVDEPDGQVGYCVLPDGTRIEEWEYYRSRTGGSEPQP